MVLPQCHRERIVGRKPLIHEGARGFDGSHILPTKSHEYSLLGSTHAEGLGLYLEITKAGGRYWRMKYRFAGKEKRLAFGVHPDISLKIARESASKARKLLQDNQDPGRPARSKRPGSSTKTATPSKPWPATGSNTSQPVGSRSPWAAYRPHSKTISFPRWVRAPWPA
ncbi:hypothetical protein GmRootA79_16710 [Acidovorax sp. A79]